MIYALDIETTGLDRFHDRVLCVGVYAPDNSFLFWTVEEFQNWLAKNGDAAFILHNGSFDVNFLHQYGCDISDHWAYDTRSLASILIPRPGKAEGQDSVFGLENLGIVLLGRNAYKLDRTQMQSYNNERIGNYCLEDCKLTYELFELFKQKKFGDREWQFIRDWLMPATKLCAELEWNGLYVDRKGLEVYQKEIEAKRDQVKAELEQLSKQAIIYFHELQSNEVRKQYKEMYEKAKAKAKDQAKCSARYEKLESDALLRLEPFNWNSSVQLKWLLKDYYCLDIHNDREDKETTNEAMLKSLDHPVAQKLVEYRELEKLVSTCIPALLENQQENNLVHAHYHIGGTRTGRLSSSNPNLQQIPKGKLRSYVQASKQTHTLLTIDYSQIEVRIIAELAREKELIDAFEKEIDPYSVIAQKLLKIDCDVREIKARFKKERDVSKTAGLSILYGTGPAKLQEVLNKELNRSYSLRECKQFIEDYRAGFPAVAELKKRTEWALANGKVHYNLLGRPFYLESNDDLYMKALNTLVQGSASDLVIFSQTNFVRPKLKELEVDFKYRLLVHDEVVIELPENEAELLATEVIIPEMTNGIKNFLSMTTPLKVEYTISREWAKP